MNTKHNIIITIDWFLPGTNSGGPVRSITNMLTHLKEFNFFIVTRNTDYCSTKAYDSIIPNQWTVHSDNVKVYYFSEDWLTKKNIEILIKDVDSTTIYINGIYSKFFSIYPLQIAKRLNLNTIIRH
jgi:hypothetical protein